MKNEKNCAIYIRVSTDDQIEYSPDSQLKLCKKYAKENNINIIEECIYREEGISGTKADKRPQFQEMIATAKSKNCPFNTILVYDFSRFARNKNESVMYKTLLRKNLKIDVISITQPLSDRKESVILESMYEAMDEYYSLNLSENVIRGKLEKASRGEFQGGNPYGYKYNKITKLLEIDQEQAKIVRLIFENWNNGISFRKIIQYLNSLGIKTDYANSFTNRTIMQILNNPIYIGKIRFTVGGTKRNYNNPNTLIFDGKHERIIDDETWNISQNHLKEHNELWFRYKKTGVVNEHWLRGILKCKDCGKSMIKNKSYNRAKAYFQCSNYSKMRCTSHFIREEIVVEKILEQLKIDFQNKIEINIIHKNSIEEVSGIEYLENELKKLNQKLERIKNAYINEIDTIEEYRENKLKIEKQKRELEKQIKKINSNDFIKKEKDEIYSNCKKAYEILSDNETSDEIKYNIAHKLFDKILYDKENNSLLIYYKGIAMQ